MKTRLSIFVAAVFVRAIVLYHFYAQLSSEKYLAEPVAIAKSLLLQHTFGGVYGRAEPTAWLAPGYPMLVAIVFCFFGIGTATATKVLLVLNGFFSALTAVVTYELGKRVLSNTAGLISGWGWALSGYIASVSFLIWDTSVSTLLLSLAVLLTLTRQQATRTLSWILVGSLWGFAALFSPAVLAPFAVLLVYFAARGRLQSALLAAAACMLVLVPWSVRNWQAFHQLFLVRDNMWAEIYFGNSSYALHPMGSSGVYQKVGEGPFLRMLKERTLHWIAAHPADFAAQSASRALKFWTLPRFWDGTLPVCLGLLGLAAALHRRRSCALPLLLIMAAYPLVYYMSVVFSRFRYVIDPIIYIFAGYGLHIVMEYANLVRYRMQREPVPLMQGGSEDARNLHRVTPV